MKRRRDSQEYNEDDGDTMVTLSRSMFDSLICSHCGEYFRNPVTIMDCLHSLCRVCMDEIKVTVRGKKFCEVCNKEYDPFVKNTVMPDRRLKEIVDTIIPIFERRRSSDNQKDTVVASSGTASTAPPANNTETHSSPGSMRTARSLEPNTTQQQASGDTLVELILSPYICDPVEALPKVEFKKLQAQARIKVRKVEEYVLRKLRNAGYASTGDINIEVLSGDTVLDSSKNLHDALGLTVVPRKLKIHIAYRRKVEA
mmetsp:Transcript_14796/g.22286  ORF Transcript_14796/g.22286 Transcript_14796/m.22286 type:complete len:256 (+) Transcript_14796:34-801(+)